jgi:3-dehydroquinate dehydratase type I
MNNLSKYCLSVSGPDFSNCEKQLQLSEFVELRLDLYNLSPKELDMLLSTPKTYIATCRLKSEEKSIALLKKAIKLGASFIDIDISRSNTFLKTLKEICVHYGCKFIVSYHNSSFTPSEKELKTVYKNAISLGADFVKIATQSNSESDNTLLLGLYHLGENIIAFGMGKIGKITRIESLHLGSPFTYVSASTSSQTASGQYTLEETIQIENGINLINKPICLIGFMGVGKSTVARTFANKNNLPLIDTDQEIKTNSLQSIASIFETKGEEYFRQLESQTIEKALQNKNAIIACGGGIISKKRNRNILRNESICIWLRAEVEHCLSQIKEDNRPLLQNKNRLQNAQDLYATRESFYESTAHIIIDIKEKSITQICQIIHEKINPTHHL